MQDVVLLWSRSLTVLFFKEEMIIKRKNIKQKWSKRSNFTGMWYPVMASVNWARPAEGVMKKKHCDIIWGCVLRCGNWVRPAESGDGYDDTKRQWSLCSVTHCVSDTLLLRGNMLPPELGLDYLLQRYLHFKKLFHVFSLYSVCILNQKWFDLSKFNFMLFYNYCLWSCCKPVMEC